MLKQRLDPLPLGVLEPRHDVDQARRASPLAPGRQLGEEFRRVAVVLGDDVWIEAGPGHVDPVLLERGEPAVPLLQPLGIEGADARLWVFLQHADDRFDRVLADHVDAVLGVEPCLLIAQGFVAGHGGADRPELHRPATFGEDELAALALDEPKLAGGRVQEPADVDDRLVGEGIVVGQHAEPGVRPVDHFLQRRPVGAGRGPGEVDQAHAVDAAVVGDLGGHDDRDSVLARGQVELCALDPTDVAMVGLGDQVHLAADVAGEVHFDRPSVVEPVVLGHPHDVTPEPPGVAAAFFDVEGIGHLAGRRLVVVREPLLARQ